MFGLATIIIIALLSSILFFFQSHHDPEFHDNTLGYVGFGGVAVFFVLVLIFGLTSSFLPTKPVTDNIPLYPLSSDTIYVTRINLDDYQYYDTLAQTSDGIVSVFAGTSDNPRLK